MTEPEDHNLDAATRAQVTEFLRMTPADRLRSLVNTVTFIQRARLRMPRPDQTRATEPDPSGQ